MQHRARGGRTEPTTRPPRTKAAPDLRYIQNIQNRLNLGDREAPLLQGFVKADENRGGNGGEKSRREQEGERNFRSPSCSVERIERARRARRARRAV